MALSMCMHEVWNTCSSVNKVDVSWLSAFKMNTIEISWSVKGYHYFKVKPNPREVMEVRREFNNPVDPNAMSVLREGGEQVGRVPANLCGAFRQLLEIGYTRKIIRIYTGSIGHCQNTHVRQPYKRRCGKISCWRGCRTFLRLQIASDEGKFYQYPGRLAL